ncbi:MAG: nucleotidyltransferase family protein [Nitrospirae bacterium]|nr:nucleotidyltransferase family protein [Nitrospirota bacterium]
MDFKLVLDKLLTLFREQNIQYALMGGFALAAWGVPRGTVDMDFLVQRDDMEKIDGIMKGLGYECRYKSENVSQYLSPVKVFGEVDFLHAFRSPSLKMLQRAEEKKYFGETLSVRVLKVEDLIGFKVQAIANNKDRTASDMADIEALLVFNKTSIDWSLLEEYFSLFGLSDQLRELRMKYGADQ